MQKIKQIDFSGIRLQKELLAKNWTIRDAAQYLGVSRGRMYSIFKEKFPAMLWFCAVQGMPDYTTEIKSALKASRPSRKQRLTKTTTQINAAEFEVGDEFVVVKHCWLGDEGARGLIRAVNKKEKLLQIEVNLLSDSFSFDDFYTFFATTGINNAGKN